MDEVGENRSIFGTPFHFRNAFPLRWPDFGRYTPRRMATDDFWKHRACAPDEQEGVNDAARLKIERLRRDLILRADAFDYFGVELSDEEAADPDLAVRACQERGLEGDALRRRHLSVLERLVGAA